MLELQELGYTANHGQCWLSNLATRSPKPLSWWKCGCIHNLLRVTGLQCTMLQVCMPMGRASLVTDFSCIGVSTGLLLALDGRTAPWQCKCLPHQPSVPLTLFKPLLLLAELRLHCSNGTIQALDLKNLHGSGVSASAPSGQQTGQKLDTPGTCKYCQPLPFATVLAQERVARACMYCSMCAHLQLLSTHKAPSTYSCSCLSPQPRRVANPGSPSQSPQCAYAAPCPAWTWPQCQHV